MTRILSLDGASATGAGFGLVQRQAHGLVELMRHWETGQGAAVRLPALLAATLAARDREDAPDLLAVLTGPGSFTGLRATLALAHGLAAGFGIAVVGVSVGEALAPMLAPMLAMPDPADTWSCGSAWCVSQARRDRVFIEQVDRAGLVSPPLGFGLDSLPDPGKGGLVLAGDARDLAGALLTARGLCWQPGPLRPDPVAIAAAALRRRDGLLPPAEAQPLYVDPPEARPPPGAGGRC